MATSRTKKSKERENKVLLLKAMRERLVRESRSNLFRFTLATMPTFRPADFHRRYYDILSRFAHKEIKKLMVFMPPQHGKSEGSTRRLPAFIEGMNPDTRLAVVSYSATKAKKFNREIQRIIDSKSTMRSSRTRVLVCPNSVRIPARATSVQPKNLRLLTTAEA